LENLSFNGGNCGWSDFALKGTAAITGIFAFDISLLNDSDYFFATGTSGRFHVKDGATGSARSQWDA
jgi:hypothetical protein